VSSCVQRHIGGRGGEVEGLTADAVTRRSEKDRQRLFERLIAGRRIDPVTGCWEWQGRRDRWGYGRITVAHRRQSVHRLAAALFLGFDLASPLHILHRCHNPPCFRPDHLRPGTHQENMRDRPPR
jgi:hypothetical protein